VPQHGVAPARISNPTIVGSLAKFFPEATPVRIGVRVTPAGAESFGESTVIEFGTSREVLFALTQPLEFGDRIHLENSDSSLKAEATVVAVQYHNGRTALAARFTTEVPNWIVKP
jgi:hypothetical protein